MATAVAFLTGRAFPQSDPRVLGVRWLPAAETVGREREAARGRDRGRAADAVGRRRGVRRHRRGERRRLASDPRRAAARARRPGRRPRSARRSSGSSSARCARVCPTGSCSRRSRARSAAPLESARRAALRLGDLSAVAALAAARRRRGADGGERAPGVPLLPMLAQIAEDFDEVLAAHGGTSALEYKYDGARIQLHRDGERVSIWTRRLSDVTRSLPDVVETARRELVGAPFILDGEVLALDPAGRPLPFQELMRRFRRVHEVDRLVREMPLTLHFFDCLMADGRSLIDEPYERRWEALSRGHRRAPPGRARAGDVGRGGARVPGPGARRGPRGRRGERSAQHLRARRPRQAMVQAEGRRDRRLRDRRGRPGLRAAAAGGSRTIIWRFATATRSRTSARRSRDSPTRSSSR